MKKEPAFIQSLQEASMNKGRSRFFLVFLFISFFFWFIAKFSKTYTEVIAFQLYFKNIPVAIIPQISSPLKLETTLKATGFQFLYYRFIDKGLQIDLGEASFEEGKLNAPLAAQFQELQEQLLGETQIINYFPTVIELDYEQQVTKRLPVVAPPMELAPGYTAIDISFQPDSIEVLGPERELNELEYIQAVYLSNNKIQKSFTSKVNIAQLGEEFVLESNQVEMIVNVDRFSEEAFSLPVVLKNAPLNQVFKFFPSKLTFTFSAALQDLKNITPNDFVIGVDYNKLNPQDNQALLEVFAAPEGIKNMRWEPKTVEYLIRE